MRSSPKIINERVAVFRGVVLRGREFSGVGWGEDCEVAQVPGLHNAAFQCKYILYGMFVVTVDG